MLKYNLPVQPRRSHHVRKSSDSGLFNLPLAIQEDKNAPGESSGCIKVQQQQGFIQGEGDRPPPPPPPFENPSSKVTTVEAKRYVTVLEFFSKGVF